jgi:hypothetical protein
MAEATAAAGRQGGRHQRSWRNYLLDQHFQLKYTGYLVGIAVFLSGALGGILYTTSEKLIQQSQEGVKQAELVAERGREVVKESKKVSAVVQMNIAKEYADSPDVLEAFKSDDAQHHAELGKRQEQLESQSKEIRTQFERLADQQRAMRLTLFGVLGALVVLIGLAGIVITHKVAGPIFKMKRQLREVGDGKLRVPGPLRKGDELVDFFEAFREMVASLRKRQEREIELLDAAIAKLEGKAESPDLAPLRELRSDMNETLEASQRQ